MCGYDLIPFEPEPMEKLLARFPKALKALPLPPPREHVFDFEQQVRMIVSLDLIPAQKGVLACYLHLSFGLPPWVKWAYRDPEDFRESIRKLATEFVGTPEPAKAVFTDKAYHLFYLKQ